MRAKIEANLPRKRGPAIAGYDKAWEKFMDQVQYVEGWLGGWMYLPVRVEGKPLQLLACQLCRQGTAALMQWLQHGVFVVSCSGTLLLNPWMEDMCRLSAAVLLAGLLCSGAAR